MVSQSKDITVEYDCHIHVSLKDCHLMTLLAAFAVLLPQLLTEFLENILLGYARQVMAWPHKPFACDRCGNDQGFIWKTQHGRPTQLLTTFTWGRSASGRFNAPPVDTSAISPAGSWGWNARNAFRRRCSASWD